MARPKKIRDETTTDKQPLIPEPKQSRAHLLASRLKKTNPDVGTAGDSVKSWRYVDFCDPKRNRPTIAMEWLFGARGLLSGRLMNLIATYSKGKSSFMYFIYACAQKIGAWCCHLESEGAPAPADFIASYGADPDDIMIAGKTSLEDTMIWMDETESTIRGEWGSAVDPDTGKKMKTKFTDPLDPGLDYPIVMGIDSLSSLGLLATVDVDVVDAKKNSGIGQHARKMRGYLRDHVGRFSQRLTLLMLASHQTKKVNMGGGKMQPKDADVDSIAKEAVGIQATYEVIVSSKPWRAKTSPFTQYGDIIELRTTKNKISPRGRAVSMYLNVGNGFDMVETDTNWFLTCKSSPFVDPKLTPRFGTLAPYGTKITCPLLQEKAFQTREEFIAALYSRTDIVAAMREALRIRGFGFDFEVNYSHELDSAEDCIIDPGDDNGGDSEDINTDEE